MIVSLCVRILDTTLTTCFSSEQHTTLQQQLVQTITANDLNYHSECYCCSHTGASTLRKICILLHSNVRKNYIIIPILYYYTNELEYTRIEVCCGANIPTDDVRRMNAKYVFYTM
jgi:hypothetical protein